MYGISVLERFWSRVNPPTGISECWPWTYSKDTDGYGQFSVRKIKVKPHRLAYELVFEKIPTGLQIDHLCRNRACVNPYHMEAVTPKVNALRGKWATQTHCIHGHLLSPGNILTNPGILAKGHRVCKTCSHLRVKSYHEANREAFNARRRKEYAADPVAAAAKRREDRHKQEIREELQEILSLLYSTAQT